MSDIDNMSLPEALKYLFELINFKDNYISSGYLIMMDQYNKCNVFLKLKEKLSFPTVNWEDYKTMLQLPEWSSEERANLLKELNDLEKDSKIRKAEMNRLTIAVERQLDSLSSLKLAIDNFVESIDKLHQEDMQKDLQSLMEYSKKYNDVVSKIGPVDLFYKKINNTDN